MSELRVAAAEERAAALRIELEAVRRLLAGLPDPPEPLTSGELAARALAPVARRPIRQMQDPADPRTAGGFRSRDHRRRAVRAGCGPHLAGGPGGGGA